MSESTILLRPDELSGLAALQQIARADGEDTAEPDAFARQVLREAIDARLDALGLPWAPADVAVVERIALRHQPGSGWHARYRALRGNRTVVRAVQATLLVASVVLLVGGYGGGHSWSWTGFSDNNQLWDWLHMLVLPVSFAVLPLWLRYSSRMDRRWRLAYAAAIGAFTVFVIVGYTDPIGWTGFSGNTLWDWLTLILLPVTLITVSTWAATSRRLRTEHRIVLGALFVGWVVTLVGGYAWSWAWTGYEGNSLWDWIDLLLAPIVFPTVIAPALIGFVTGDLEHEVKAERRRAVQAGLTPASAGA